MFNKKITESFQIIENTFHTYFQKCTEGSNILYVEKTFTINKKSSSLATVKVEHGTENASLKFSIVY